MQEGTTATMDDKLRQVITSGKSIKDTKDIKEQVKGKVMGEKARMAFTCPACGKKWETKNEYQTGENLAQSALKKGASKTVSRMFRRIPILGPIIGETIEGFIKGDPQMAKLQLQQDAFEEVRDKFKFCEKCDMYGCESCINTEDGTCGKCKTGGTKGEGGEGMGEFRVRFVAKNNEDEELHQVVINAASKDEAKEKAKGEYSGGKEYVMKVKTLKEPGA